MRHSLINTDQGVLAVPRMDDDARVKLGTPDVRAQSSTALFPVGTALIRDDGVYRYVKNGAVAITCGKLAASPATLHADYDNDLAVAAAAAIGATSVTVTASASQAITEDLFKDGWLHINNEAGEGCCYKIKSHPAASVGTSCVLTLVDALEVALVAGTSLVALQHNLFRGIIVSPTTVTGVPVGSIWVSSLTALYFGWIKTKGISPLLTNGTLYVGKLVVPSGTTAGAVDHGNVAVTTGSTTAADSTSGALVEDSAAAETVLRGMGTAVDTTYDIGSLKVPVGRVLKVAASTEYSLVKIDLDPSW